MVLKKKKDYPWTQPATGGMPNVSSVRTRTRRTHIFSRFGCRLARSAGAFQQKFLRRSSIRSSSRVRCWLGNLSLSLYLRRSSAGSLLKVRCWLGNLSLSLFASELRRKSIKSTYVVGWVAGVVSGREHPPPPPPPQQDIYSMMEGDVDVDVAIKDEEEGEDDDPCARMVCGAGRECVLRASQRTGLPGGKKSWQGCCARL